MDEPRGSTSEIIKQRRQILYDLIHCGICFLKGAFVVSQMVKFCLPSRRPRFDPWVGKIPWRRELQPRIAILQPRILAWKIP